MKISEMIKIMLDNRSVLVGKLYILFLLNRKIYQN